VTGGKEMKKVLFVVGTGFGVYFMFDLFDLIMPFADPTTSVPVFVRLVAAIGIALVTGLFHWDFSRNWN